MTQSAHEPAPCPATDAPEPTSTLHCAAGHVLAQIERRRTGRVLVLAQVGARLALYRGTLEIECAAPVADGATCGRVRVWHP